MLSFTAATSGRQQRHSLRLLLLGTLLLLSIHGTSAVQYYVGATRTANATLGQFTTITAANAAAKLVPISTGAIIINVDAGSYTESFTITGLAAGNTLTLQGPQASMPAGPMSAPPNRSLSHTTAASTEALITGSVTIQNANDVTLAGLFIYAQSSTSVIIKGATGTVVRNCIIVGNYVSGVYTGTTSATHTGIGSQSSAAASAFTGGYTIEGNRFAGGQ